jgi:ribosomal protein L40E
MAKISSERKATYYIGIGMMILGFLLFISVFFSAASFMNNPFAGSGIGAGRGPSFTNAVLGMVLIIAGSIIMNIGAKGAAGSGLLLDPQKAREDLKPYSEAAGEMINDAINNIDVVDKIANSRSEKEIIKIRCRSCGSLNDEDAKYCKSCGEKI